MFTCRTGKCNTFFSFKYMRSLFFSVQISLWEKWKSRFLWVWVVEHFIKLPRRALRKTSPYFCLNAWLFQVFSGSWVWRMPRLSSHLNPSVDYCFGLVHLYSVPLVVEVGLIGQLVDNVTSKPLQKQSWVLSQKASGTLHPFCCPMQWET